MKKPSPRKAIYTRTGYANNQIFYFSTGVATLMEQRKLTSTDLVFGLKKRLSMKGPSAANLVKRILDGDSSITLPVASALAEYFQVTIDEIIRRGGRSYGPGEPDDW